MITVYLEYLAMELSTHIYESSCSVDSNVCAALLYICIELAPFNYYFAKI